MNIGRTGPALLEEVVACDQMSSPELQLFLLRVGD